MVGRAVGYPFPEPRSSSAFPRSSEKSSTSSRILSSPVTLVLVQTRPYRPHPADNCLRDRSSSLPRSSSPTTLSPSSHPLLPHQVHPSSFSVLRDRRREEVGRGSRVRDTPVTPGPGDEGGHRVVDVGLAQDADGGGVLRGVPVVVDDTILGEGGLGHSLTPTSLPASGVLGPTVDSVSGSALPGLSSPRSLSVTLFPDVQTVPPTWVAPYRCLGSRSSFVCLGLLPSRTLA